MLRQTMGNINRFSQMSERAGSLRPGRRLFCSTSIAWTSVLLQVYEQPAFVEDYVSAPSPDLLVVAVLKDAYYLESFSAGSWKSASYRPGISGVTAPHTSNRLRWRSKPNAAPVLIRLYIPQEYFFEAADEDQLRMHHAEQLLRETDLSIGEIALTCGYIHQGHFAASFSREFNCSPAAYRGQDPPSLLNRTFGPRIRNLRINR